MQGQLTVVVHQRGWVTIGYLQRDGDLFVLTDSRTLINWGTTNMGIEHLSEVGPTPQTKYSTNKSKDRFHVLTPIRMLECTPEAVMAWQEAWK